MHLSQKIKSICFHTSFQAKLSPGFLSSLARQKEITSSRKVEFFETLFFPSAEMEAGGRNYGKLKMTKIKLVRVLLVTHFDKFHHLFTTHICGFCVFVP